MSIRIGAVLGRRDVSATARRGRRTIAAAVSAAVALTVVGCSTSSGGPGPSARQDAGEGAGVGELLGHVHGIGSDPGDGTVYVASHFGVFRLAEDEEPHRVADRWQDTMAFTVVGPGHFLASGHPDLREDLPTHLGLIESTDAAESWTPVSLAGRADFHALEATQGQLYGYDATSSQLLSSTDAGRSWVSLGRHDVVDLAADPENPRQLLITTSTGELVALDGDSSDARRLDGTPPLTLVDWPTADLLLGIDPDGAVYISPDGGGSWQRTSSVTGTPHAVDVSSDAWLVATDRGIYRSTDDGRSWTPLLN